jgi:hypothetical protein
LTIFSMSCISICSKIKEWFIFPEWLYVYYVVYILYFMLKQRNGLLLGLGFSIVYTCTGKKNCFYLSTPSPLATKLHPDPDATSPCEIGRLRWPPPRSDRNPALATGKPVHSTNLSVGNIGLLAAAADYRALEALVCTGRHFGKSVRSTDFSPCFLNLPVFSVDKPICCVYRLLLFISLFDFWVPYT